MLSDALPGGSPWLLIEASREGVLRFATAAPSAKPRLSQVREVEVAGLPTFTDALQRFEREAGISLSGTRCAIAIAGAASGDTISLVRSRWTISRAGLAAVFGVPATILNDVAARAWATRSGTANIEPLRLSSAPGITRPGRYVMVMAEEGLGAAIIDVDREDGIRVLETEAGHMDFAPTSEREEKLAKCVRGVAPCVSWEKLLLVDRHDPVWADACPDLPERERPRLLATILGRLCVNLMHSAGAWQGVIVTGSRAARLLESGNRIYFESAFTTRRNFSRLVMTAPVCLVQQHEAVLTGAAERLAHDLHLDHRAAA